MLKDDIKKEKDDNRKMQSIMASAYDKTQGAMISNNVNTNTVNEVKYLEVPEEKQKESIDSKHNILVHRIKQYKEMYEKACDEYLIARKKMQALNRELSILNKSYENMIATKIDMIKVYMLIKKRFGNKGMLYTPVVYTELTEKYYANLPSRLVDIAMWKDERKKSFVPVPNVRIKYAETWEQVIVGNDNKYGLINRDDPYLGALSTYEVKDYVFMRQDDYNTLRMKVTGVLQKRLPKEELPYFMQSID
jgi:hypothetical protein